MHDSRGIEIVNFTISLALSAGTLMASAGGTPYRLVPANFYPWRHQSPVRDPRAFPTSAWRNATPPDSDRADRALLAESSHVLPSSHHKLTSHLQPRQKAETLKPRDRNFGHRIGLEAKRFAGQPICRPRAGFTKYLTIILRLSYDNGKVSIDLRRTSNIQNIPRRTQGFSRVRFAWKIVRSSEVN